MGLTQEFYRLLRRAHRNDHMHDYYQMLSELPCDIASRVDRNEFEETAYCDMETWEGLVDIWADWKYKPQVEA